MRGWKIGLAGVTVAGLGAWQGDDLAATVAGLGAWQGDDLAATVAGLDERVTAIEERLEGRPVGTAEAGGALRFEGDGRIVSEPFVLDEGTTLFTTTLGSARFANIELLPAPGTGVGDEIYVSGGNSQGTNGTIVPEAGDFVLAGDGNGTWTVVIEQ